MSFYKLELKHPSHPQNLGTPIKQSQSMMNKSKRNYNQWIIRNSCGSANHWFGRNKPVNKAVYTFGGTTNVSHSKDMNVYLNRSVASEMATINCCQQKRVRPTTCTGKRKEFSYISKQPANIKVI